MSRIFISYRRADSAMATGRLYDRLEPHFGADRLFMDIDTIPLGIDFRQVIADAVSQCAIVLAVIGDRWLTITDDDGQRRLDDPGDFVRLEIAAALERDIPVVPVLVQGARMPGEAELPEPLKPLAYRNAIELSHTRYNADVARLISELERIVATDTPQPAITAPLKPERVAFPLPLANRRYWVIGAVIALLTAVAIVLALSGVLSGGDDDPNETPDTQAAALATSTATAQPSVSTTSQSTDTMTAVSPITLNPTDTPTCTRTPTLTHTPTPTPTRTRTPTLTHTRTPTLTHTPTPYPTYASSTLCGGTGPFFQIGDRVGVSESSGNEGVRDRPGAGGEVVMRSSRGYRFQIVDGPECHLDQWYWYLYSFDLSVYGWLSQGPAGERWLCLYSGPDCD